MKTFKDNSGKSWTLVIDTAASKRLRDLIGVDLLTITDRNSTLLADLGNDPEKIVDAIYVVLKPDLDAANISDVQFARLLAGVVLDTAADAFMEELPNFFRKRQRTLVSDALAKVQTASDLITQKGRMAIAAIDVEKLVAEHLNGPLPGETSTSSPG